MLDGTTSTTRVNAVDFNAFLEGWLERQEHYLDELLSAEQNSHVSRDEELRELVARVLSHYQQYYKEKSQIARSDTFLVFSPTWFTSLDRSFFWVTRFKPRLIFQVLNDSVSDLTSDQRARVDRSKAETRVDERMVADKVAKIQESVGDLPVSEAAKARGRWVLDGGYGMAAVGLEEEESAVVEMVRSKLEAIVGIADLLRRNTVAKVVEILSPVQNVKFLTAVGQLQLSVRSLGLEFDAGNGETGGSSSCS